MNDCDEILCRTVADCDEFLDCIDDMRRIDASSSSPAPARIDDLKTSLQRERAMYAEHCEQEIIACKATHTERREREARWRDELPNERLRREPDEDALGQPKRLGSAIYFSRAISDTTDTEPACTSPRQEHDSSSLVWFDAKAVAAAADGLTGSRSRVKLAMQNSMRSNKRLGKSV
mmetsp:Transcript_6649/g.15660  ORF Transcript_6649/g.15660 Transcript_6649/m.15660 type:complete len:176 (-) Transcript_6649:50-577(-)